MLCQSVKQVSSNLALIEVGGRIFLIGTVNFELVALLRPGLTNRNVQMTIYPIYSQYPANVGLEESLRKCSVQISAVSQDRIHLCCS